MSSFLNKIVKPLGIAVGATVLGSYLFPQTTAQLTGGLFGDANGTGALSGLGGTAAAGVGTGSIWNNPTVLSSGILAGTSLLTNLFGSNAEEDQMKLNQQQLEEQKRQFDQKMILEREQMAQALQIAKVHAASAGAGAGTAAAAQRAIAKANAIGQSTALKAQAMQVPLQARQNQAETAQNTGAQSGAFFNNMSAMLQQPAMRAAQ